VQPQQKNLKLQQKVWASSLEVGEEEFLKDIREHELFDQAPRDAFRASEHAARCEDSRLNRLLLHEFVIRLNRPGREHVKRQEIVDRRGKVGGRIPALEYRAKDLHH